MGKLDGRIALVTGANSGIGLASARLFATEGAQIIASGRDADAIANAAREIGHQAIALAADVSRSTDLNRLYAEIRQRFGRLDIVFANAGIAPVSPFEAVTEAGFDEAFATNVRGLFFTVQQALPLMAQGGSVILTSSIANRKGTAGMSVYSATKAAVRSLARSLTAELKGRGIRVNSLSPGPTETPIFAKMGVPPEHFEAFAEPIRAQIPLGRIGQADEIARAALFLACGDSEFITGIDLCVDGGAAQV